MITSRHIHPIPLLLRRLQGWLGTARFVLPLLLDAQLNKLLPQFFSPPTLRGLQDERMSFSALESRKKRERFILVFMLMGATILLRSTAAVVATFVAIARRRFQL